MGEYAGGDTGTEKKGGFLGLSTGCVACCGCAGLTAVGAVVAVIVVFGYVSSMVGGMISNEPMEIAEVEYTPAEAFGVNLKFDQYSKAVERGEDPTLVFTDRELNILVANQGRKDREEDPDADEQLEGFQLTVREDDSVNLKFSQRTGKNPDGTYQYLNLDLDGRAEVADGVWDVSLSSLTIGTSPVPGVLLNLVQQALADSTANPELQESKQVVKSFKVSGGKIELQLDPEAVKKMKAKAEEDAEDGPGAGPVGSTSELDLFSFVEDEKAKISNYDSAKDDAKLFEKASLKFNVTREEARATYIRIRKKMDTGLEER